MHPQRLLRHTPEPADDFASVSLRLVVGDGRVLVVTSCCRGRSRTSVTSLAAPPHCRRTACCCFRLPTTCQSPPPPPLASSAPRSAPWRPSLAAARAWAPLASSLGRPPKPLARAPTASRASSASASSSTRARTRRCGPRRRRRCCRSRRRLGLWRSACGFWTTQAYVGCCVALALWVASVDWVLPASAVPSGGDGCRAWGGCWMSGGGLHMAGFGTASGLKQRRRGRACGLGLVVRRCRYVHVLPQRSHCMVFHPVVSSAVERAGCRCRLWSALVRDAESVCWTNSDMTAAVSLCPEARCSAGRSVLFARPLHRIRTHKSWLPGLSSRL